MDPSDDEYEDVSREQVRAAAAEHAVACVTLLVAGPPDTLPPDMVLDSLLNSQLLSSGNLQRLRDDRRRKSRNSSGLSRVVAVARRLATRPWIANRYVCGALRLGQTAVMVVRLVSIWSVAMHLASVAGMAGGP
jgi:hypothetical protein